MSPVISPFCLFGKGCFTHKRLTKQFWKWYVSPLISCEPWIIFPRLYGSAPTPWATHWSWIDSEDKVVAASGSTHCMSACQGLRDCLDVKILALFGLTSILESLSTVCISYGTIVKEKGKNTHAHTPHTQKKIGQTFFWRCHHALDMHHTLLTYSTESFQVYPETSLKERNFGSFQMCFFFESFMNPHTYFRGLLSLWFPGTKPYTLEVFHLNSHCH